MRNLLITTAFTALMLSTWSLGTAHAFTNHPEPAPDRINLECAPYMYTPDRDRNPPYKVNVYVQMNGSSISDYDVVYTLRSGDLANRSQQYTLARMYQEPGKLAWTWTGNRGPHFMIGQTWKNNQGWWYGEELYNRGGRREFGATFSCYRMDGGA